MVAIINNVMLWGLTAVSSLKARLAEERGQDLLEYAVLGGLIAAALVAAAVVLAITGGVEAMATGIKNCIDFTDSTTCDPGP